MGADIRYTLDGSLPTKRSSLYIAGAELILKNGETLRAIAVRGDAVSEVSEWVCRADTEEHEKEEKDPSDDKPSGTGSTGGTTGVGGEHSLVKDMLEAEEHIAYGPATRMGPSCPAII